MLGGILGNYDVYTMASVDPVLAGIFFVPLFLLFSVFWFTFLTAMVLRKYDFCAQSIDQSLIKYKLDEQVTIRCNNDKLHCRLPCNVAIFSLSPKSNAYSNKSAPVYAPIH